MLLRVLVLSLVAMLAAVGGSSAQVIVQSGGTSVTFNACPAGQFLNGAFVNNVAQCATPSGGGGSVSLTAAGCVSITGTSPNFTIGTINTAVTKAASFPVAATDNCKNFIYKSTTAGTATILAANATGVGNGFGFVIEVPPGSAPLTLSSPATIYGGPSVLSPGQSAYIYADDNSQWAMFVGVAQVVPNPNAFH